MKSSYKKVYSIILVLAMMFGLQSIALINSYALESDTGWATMYSWEDVTANTLPGYVSKGSNKSSGVNAISTVVYQNPDSKQVLSIYQDSTATNPVTATGTPEKITLNTDCLVSATGLRALINMNNNPNNLIGIYTGICINGDYYYVRLNETNYLSTYNYFYYVGKTYTKLGDNTATLTLTADDVKNVTQICFWSYVRGAFTFRCDDIQYTCKVNGLEDDTSKLLFNVTQKEQTASTRIVNHDDTKEDIALFLVIGQSNATTTVGYNHEIGPVKSGTLPAISEDTTMPAAGTVYSSGYQKAITSLTDANDSVNMISTDLTAKTLSGFTPSFGKEWYEQTGEKVVFVQAAVGATCMHQWVPDPENYTCGCGRTNGYLSTAISIYQQSYDALSKQYNIVNAGYIWNQGENDESYDKAGAAILDSNTYYNAYMSMHNELMATNKLDFGSIMLVRSRNFDTYGTSKTLTFARAAQYQLCNDVDRLYMITRIFEQCDSTMMLSTDYYIHCTQKTYNMIGKDAASNLKKALRIDGAVPDFTGISVYDKKAKLLASFDAGGNLTAGNKDLSKDTTNSSDQLMVTVEPLVGSYTIDTTINKNGTYISKYYNLDWNLMYCSGITLLSMGYGTYEQTDDPVTTISNTTTASPTTVTTTTAATSNTTSETATVAVVSTAVVSTATESATTAPPVIYGDANNDGSINTKDGLLLKQYLAEWIVTINLEAADVNVDGFANGKDSLLLKQYFAEWPVKLGK